MIEIQETLADGTFLYGWKSEPPLTPIVPSYACHFTEKKIFSEEECESWNEYLLEQEQFLLDKFRTPTGDGGTGLSPLSITSRFRNFNLLKFDFHLIPKLKTEIFNGIKTILSISDNNNWQETIYANCWFNVLRKGEEMHPHSHSYHKNSLYGFHVSINAIETFTSYYHPIKFVEDTFRVPNKIGYLTLFPNYIPHSVSPNQHETHRISIAGDTFPSTWLDEPAPDTHNKHLLEIGTYNGNNELLQETR